MATIQLGGGGTSNWLPTLLISIIFVVVVYFYKDHELKNAIAQYQKQQIFIQEQVAKFGIVDSQFKDMLEGRAITVSDIEQSQTRVDSLMGTIEKLNKLDSVSNSKTDSINLDQALKILGI